VLKQCAFLPINSTSYVAHKFWLNLLFLLRIIAIVLTPFGKIIFFLPLLLKKGILRKIKGGLFEYVQLSPKTVVW